MKKVIYTAYSEKFDLSFVMEDMVNDKGQVTSTEVKGFYYGAEDKQATDIFYGKLKATYKEDV